MKRFLCFILMLLMMISCVACSSARNDTAAPTVASTAPTILEAPAPFLPGDMVTLDNLILTYESSSLNWTEHYDFLPPKEGYRYVRLNFEVEYLGENTVHVSYLEFTCYADNYECEPAYQGIDDLSTTLSTGRKGSGAVYFSVPIDAEVIEVEYHHNDTITVFTVQ